MSTVSRKAFSRRLPQIAMIAIAISMPAPAFADSSFRGFTVSDSPDQVDKIAKDDGMTVKWGAPVFDPDGNGRLATLKDGDNACGWITFNGDQKIESMLFGECFFGGEGLGLRTVAQEFVNKFGGPAEMEVISDPMCKDAEPFRFKGRTSEGEQFRIEQSCGNWKLEVTVEITPGPGKGLKF